MLSRDFNSPYGGLYHLQQKWTEMKEHCVFAEVYYCDTTKAKVAWVTWVYLQVSVNDVQGVEIGNGLQHLAHHIAGVPFWVVALIQDPVKHLSACCAVEMWKWWELCSTFAVKFDNRANGSII